MTSLTYLNFDLTFESSAEGYAVRVTDSPAGQAGAPFVFPFNELELENFLLRLGQRSSGTRRADSPEMELSKQFGGRLFDALFDDDVRAALRSSIRASEEQSAGLRIRLRFGNTPELADIPWEYLYDGGANRFLTLSRETPLVRYLELSRPVEPLQVQAPLRILVMISDPSDYDRLDVEAEWQRLLAATATLRQRGLVEIVRLDKATLLELQRQLRDNQFHIFHYIGHGVFDESADDGFLVLEEENGRGRKVSGQYVGTLLADHRSLRLAVLNSCEGGRSSRSDPFAGAAQSLVQQGLSAVVAMQFAISDDAAAVFAQEFYMALASGYPADAALAEGRRAIFATKMNAEWGIPVLFMRAIDGLIFNVSSLARETTTPQAVPSSAGTQPRLMPFIMLLGALFIIAALSFFIFRNREILTDRQFAVSLATPTASQTQHPANTATATATFTPRPSNTATATNTPQPTPTVTRTQVYLRPVCGKTLAVSADAFLELRYGIWATRGFDLAQRNESQIDIELRIDGNLIQGQRVLPPTSDIGAGLCGKDYDDAFWIFHIVNLSALARGQHDAQVTYRFLERIEDGYGDVFTPNTPFTQQYTISVE